MYNPSKRRYHFTGDQSKIDEFFTHSCSRLSHSLYFHQLPDFVVISMTVVLAFRQTLTIASVARLAAAIAAASP
jgi:hypothetical protein